MPLPKPTGGESRSDFVSRCVSSGVMQDEYPKDEQRVAVCESLFDEKSAMPNKALGPYENDTQEEFMARCVADADSVDRYPDDAERQNYCRLEWDMHKAPDLNSKLALAIRARKSKQTEFGYGITTAASYLKQVAECNGNADCLAALFGGMPILAKAVKDAESRLVYANPEMLVDAKSLFEVKSSSGNFRDVLRKGSGVEIPKNTLMVFRNVLTTSREDRDKDILVTAGAECDPKMPLLWQHIHTTPLGKMLEEYSRTKDSLWVVSALIDVNDLCEDVAKMVEADMLRFSHGFRPLEYEDRKSIDGKANRSEPTGFRITRFEIMEESLVSVPSNVDAEIEMFSRGKFKSDLVKNHAKSFFDARQKSAPGMTLPAAVSAIPAASVPVAIDLQVTVNGQKTVATPPAIAAPAAAASSAVKCGCQSGQHGEPAESVKPAASAAVREHKFVEMETEKGYGLAGSWGWTQSELQESVASYLREHGVRVTDNDFVYIEAMYEGRAVVCVMYSGAMAVNVYGFTSPNDNNEPLYYEITWTGGEEPAWTGEPQRVEIVTTTEVVQRMADARAQNQKAGRKLSSNYAKIVQECIDDLTEIAGMDDVPRPAKALANQCKTMLQGMMDDAASSLGETEETSTAAQHKITVEEAKSLLLAEADMETLHRVWKAISAMIVVNEGDKKAVAYRELVGLN